MRNSCLTQEDINLFTDATPSVSFGGFYNGKWFAAAWPPELSHKNPSSSTALFEIYHVVAAAVLWGYMWSCKSILIHSDNLAVVDIINKELQTLGPRCRSTSHAGSSIFGVDILHMNPVTAPLIIASSNMILNSLSPATLSSYWSAWKRF